MLRNPSIDRLRNAQGVTLHLAVSETQHFESQRPQLTITDCVGLRAKIVGRAIDFHDEFQFRREEIHDESTDGPLAVKVVTAALSTFEVLPEQHLGERAVVTQFTRSREQRPVVRKSHGCTSTHPGAFAPPLFLEGISRLRHFW